MHSGFGRDTQSRLGDPSGPARSRTEDGVPDGATFVFSNDLDEGYSFREWRGKALVPFALPEIGQTLTFPGRVPEIFRA